MPANNNQILLPFAEKEYIDVRRAARIFGISYMSVFSLYQEGLIEMIDYRKDARKRVRYQSVVDHCDKLRIRYCIADRRPALSSNFFRHKDEDLLPFPLSDTILIDRAIEVLGYNSRTPVVNLMEEGRFEAYQLSFKGIWRISQTSFARYVDALYGKRPEGRLDTRSEARLESPSDAVHSTTSQSVTFS